MTTGHRLYEEEFASRAIQLGLWSGLDYEKEDASRARQTDDNMGQTFSCNEEHHQRREGQCHAEQQTIGFNIGECRTVWCHGASQLVNYPGATPRPAMHAMRCGTVHACMHGAKAWPHQPYLVCMHAWRYSSVVPQLGQRWFDSLRHDAMASSQHYPPLIDRQIKQCIRHNSQSTKARDSTHRDMCVCVCVCVCVCKRACQAM